MEKTEFIWHNGEFKNWDDCNVHILTHTLHYGAGAFEGIRAYETAQGPAVFRLDEHLERLKYSTDALSMKVPYSPNELKDVTVELIKRNGLRHGYIRPLAFFGSGVMGLNPTNAPVEVAIACWPWGAYLPHEMVDIKTSSFQRISPKSFVADAKICGHYVNSILAVLELQGTKYHEALFLDCNGNIAEGPGENFFIAKDGKVKTPNLGTILPGITRDTINQLLAEMNVEVEECELSLEEAYAADEAFFTGTAAEVSPIRSIDDNTIGKGEVGPITAKLKAAYLDVVHGRNPDYMKYLTVVPLELASKGAKAA